MSEYVLGVLTRPEPRKVSTALVLATVVTVIVVLPSPSFPGKGEATEPPTHKD